MSGYGRWVVVQTITEGELVPLRLRVSAIEEIGPGDAVEGSAATLRMTSGRVHHLPAESWEQVEHEIDLEEEEYALRSEEIEDERLAAGRPTTHPDYDECLGRDSGED